MAYISFKPIDYYNSTLYTGNATTNAITGVGFAPAFTWFKSRSNTSSPNIFDVLRGTYSVATSDTSAQYNAGSDGFTSLDSDGFTLNGSGGGGSLNVSGYTYTGMSWKGGTTSGITTNGSTTITPSSYSFDATSKCSVIRYTGNGTAGAKLAHGLGVAPEFILYKRTDGTDAWGAYHHSVGTSATDSAGYKMCLNTNAARNDDDAFMDDTAPDATNITLGYTGILNTNTGTYNAWCFAGVRGASKFGSFTGNGNVDGSFIYTGFRPAFLMIKCSSATENWYIFNSKTAGYNFANYSIKANDTDAQATSTYLELEANGFKIRNAAGDINANAAKFIYMAFANNPLIGSGGTPALAR